MSSTPTEAVVSASSVTSGGISDSACTIVVLPTPKPPATTILRGTKAFFFLFFSSARTQTLQQAFQHDGVRTAVVPRRLGLVHGDVPGPREVAHQHAGDR